MSGSVDSATRSRWLDWKPKAPILADLAGNGPAKPPKPGFAGFDGADRGQSSEMAAGRSPANVEPRECEPERRVLKYLSLRGGLTVPLPAVLLALSLEERGFELALDADRQVLIEPTRRSGPLTDIQRAAIVRRRLHLGAIVEYRCGVGSRSTDRLMKIALPGQALDFWRGNQ
jgi:hypothetical protein